ncbi:MAG TPA: hypothetical protein VGS62_03505 [Streptosporangiaceae bacterium]|nr:hypothetical protein [Streptosporangiaceae bacterium]
MSRYTGEHTHNHSILAGLGAGTAAVLGCFLLVAGVWHRVSSAVGTAVTVLVWALVAAVLAAAVYVVAFLGLRLRHHAAHPETLTRHAVRAEVIPPPAPALPAPAPLAALPPASTHYHFDTPDAVEAALRAMTGTERN